MINHHVTDTEKSNYYFNIPKIYVKKAYYLTKERNIVGIDGITIEEFQSNWNKNMYKIWRKLSSGNYHPPPFVRETIDFNGKIRVMAIPTVSDSIAQFAVRLYLKDKIGSIFYNEMYPVKSQKYYRSVVLAVASAHKKCQKYDWVLRLDLRKFGYSINQQRLLQMISIHLDPQWVVLINRWLKNWQIDRKSFQFERTKGIVPGTSIGNLLGDLYLHYAFDHWMKINFAHIPFERYGDDILCHCKNEQQAQQLLRRIDQRLRRYQLTLNNDKTKIIYCKDGRRTGTYPNTHFNFLKYRFQARKVTTRKGISKVVFFPLKFKKQ
ncbi:reverse transcriptase domain-containing protein [Marininema halotolerans]|uniref:RNA-directed DNA polymerase n=1 Tax=Marininema halotolerans TaxID=1155944 RepID=A0A1I6PPR7_9BACL|nr:reverse transcriptase domain-containing protein [Marininema halotolerans]SFS42197.1 RNA-directed DNA polymerase [Marininema halotolerans]